MSSGLGQIERRVDLKDLGKVLAEEDGLASRERQGHEVGLGVALHVGEDAGRLDSEDGKAERPFTLPGEGELELGLEADLGLEAIRVAEGVRGEALGIVLLDQLAEG